MRDKILSAEEFANLVQFIGITPIRQQPIDSWSRLKDSHAAQEERIEELKAAVIRRSGSSSWQEWTGIWDPTEETAVEATKRLFQRAEKAEAELISAKQDWFVSLGQLDQVTSLLRQTREVLPAEALLESNAPTSPVLTWQQQAEQEATDFMEKDGHRWVRMTTEEEAAKRLAESLV